MPVTEYIWDELNDSYLMETDGSGATTAVYTNEPVQFGNLLSQRRGNATSFYHFDGLRSTRQLTDASQNQTDAYTYSAFGETLAKTGTTTNPFGYKGALGYYANPNTGDINVRGRTYQFAQGRWQSPGIVAEFEGRSLYVFANNSPLMLTNPFGKPEQHFGETLRGVSWRLGSTSVRHQFPYH